MRPHRYAPRAPVDQEAIEAAIRRARQLRSEFFAGALERVVKAFIRWNQRHALNHRLQTLPDYLLKDIGIGRGQLPAVVSGARRRPSQVFAGALERVVKAFIRWNQRHALNHRLQALPDYLLKDIGIGRDQIPAVVSGALKRQASPLAEAVSQGSLSFLDAKKRRAGNTGPDTEKALAA